jgi:hypothetical protein
VERTPPADANTAGEEPNMSNQATANKDAPRLFLSELENATGLVEKVQGVLGEREESPRKSEVFSTVPHGVHVANKCPWQTRNRKSSKRGASRIVYCQIWPKPVKRSRRCTQAKGIASKKVLKTLSDVLINKSPLLLEDKDDAEEGGAGIEVQHGWRR